MDIVDLTSVCLLFILMKDSQADTNVRLVNGKTPNEGMIQILYNGTWSTLLDYYDGDTIYNVFAVCRMLNYSKAIKSDTIWYNPNAANSSYYPYEMRCREWADTINQCLRYKQIRSLPYKAAYAVCGNLTKDDLAVQVRLVEANQKNLGIVQILHRGVWKRVCLKENARFYWSIRTGNADAVCRMLGYKRAVGAFYHKIPATYYYWSDKIIAKRYQCNGKEKSIAACIQFDESPCSLGDYFAGVFCQETEPPLPVQYRLTSGGKPSAKGYPEIRLHGVWGRLDIYSLQPSAGYVLNYICRKLGYLGSQHGYYGKNPPKTFITWIYNKSCNVTLKNQSCNPWKLQDSPSVHPYPLSCKFASVPRYKVVSGCPPQLTIDRTGMSEKEKRFLTLYEVVIVTGRYIHQPYWSKFIIPGNTSKLAIGDGTMYGNSQNKPLKTGKEYYAHLRVVYKQKSGSLIYGPMQNDIYAFPSFKAIDCSTTQAPTTEPTTEPTDSYGEKPEAQLIGTKSVDDILMTVFLVIGAVLVIIGAIVLIYLCRRRNRYRQAGYRAEHVKLDPISS